MRNVNIWFPADKLPFFLGRLQREVDEIRDSIRVLKEKLKDAENALVRLLKTRAKLDEDIATKDRSLEIDAKACLGLRKNMAMDGRAGPVIAVPMVAS